MVKKSFFLLFFVLSNTLFGYDLSSMKSISDFPTKHRDVLVCVGTAAAVVVVAKCVQACAQVYNDYCARCAVEEAARQKAYEAAEKARKIAEAKKLMSEAYGRVERLESLAKTSLQADMVAHSDRSNYPLVVRDAYKGLIAESSMLSSRLFEAKKLLLSECGESVTIDGFVGMLTTCENLVRVKLVELSTTAIYQEALQWEQAQEMLRLERQRIENEHLARVRAEEARLEQLRLEKQRLYYERQRLEEERWRRQTDVTVVNNNVTQTVVVAQPVVKPANKPVVQQAPAKPAEKPVVVKPVAKPVAQPAPAQTEKPTNSGYDRSFDSLCDLCDQAYNG